MTVIITSQELESTINKIKWAKQKAERIETMRQALADLCGEYVSDVSDITEDIKSHIGAISGFKSIKPFFTADLNVLCNDNNTDDIKKAYNKLDVISSKVYCTQKDLERRTFNNDINEVDVPQTNNLSDIIQPLDDLKYPRVGLAPTHVLMKRIRELKKNTFGSKRMIYEIKLESIFDGNVRYISSDIGSIGDEFCGNEELKKFYTSDQFEQLIQYSYKNNIRSIVLMMCHKDNWHNKLKLDLWTTPSSDTKALFKMIEML